MKNKIRGISLYSLEARGIVFGRTNLRPSEITPAVNSNSRGFSGGCY